MTMPASGTLHLDRADFDLKEATAALERGEIVRLLAKVQSGEIDPEQLEEVLKLEAKRHWFRRLLDNLLRR
jgi:hypothetical protein